MKELLFYVRKGWLKVSQVKEFKLEDVSKAHSLIESGNSVGKLVLRP